MTAPSGIPRADLVEHLPPRALHDWVKRETGKPTGRTRLMHCPFPDHDDRRPSFGATDGQGWHCFSCDRKGTDLIDLVMQVRGFASVDDAIKELAETYWPEALTRPSRETRPEAPKRLRNAEEVLGHLLTLPEHSALSETLHTTLLSDAGAEARAYLESRGISEAAWIRHGLGYVLPDAGPPAPLGREWRGMVTFPIRAGEHVIGFTGRRIFEHAEWPDKLNTAGELWPFNMNALLLERHDEPRTHVTITEGPISALAMEEMGLGPAVALRGSEVLAKWWGLFSREYDVNLVLDPKKSETRDELRDRSIEVVDTMRSAGWWRALLPIEGQWGDPTDLWLASGFNIPEARGYFDVLVRYGPPADFVLELNPDSIPPAEAARQIMDAIVKNTPGLTMTLRYEHGPQLGYRLEIARADGKPFAVTTDPSDASLIIVQEKRPPLAEDAYAEGGSSYLVAFMAAAKKLRRRLHLAVADGIDPAILNARRLAAALSNEVRVPAQIAEYMCYRRPARGTGEVDSMDVVSPQSGRRMTLLPREEDGGQLEIPGVYAPLIPSDTRALLGLFRIFVGTPQRVDTTCEEVAAAMGIRLESGRDYDRLWDQLNRLKTWWYWDEDSESQWTFNFISGLKRYFKTGRLIIDKSIAVHEALNGSLNQGYTTADWDKLERLSDQAIGLYVAYCLRSDPHYWQVDNIASAVSSNKRPHKARAEAEQALKELESVGIRVQDRTTGRGTKMKLLTAPEYKGRRLHWDKGEPR